MGKTTKDSDRDLVDLDSRETPIDIALVARRRINDIIDAGLTFHERLWFSKGAELKKLRLYIKQNPEEFLAKQKSFAMFFAKALPSKVEVRNPAYSKSVSVDDLEKLGLKIDEIKKIAFGPQEPESEAELAYSENGQLR